MLITVINKVTHKPVDNADVNVELGAIDTEGSPGLYQQGTQFLCLQTDTPGQECGTSLNDLQTDGNGQVRVLYWAPGELVKAHVELYAQACTPSACLLKRAKSKITVYPYRIYHYEGELSPETVQDLVDMVSSDGYFDIASHAAEQGLEASADAWMDLLGVEEGAVTLALGSLGFGVTFTLIDLAHATSELLEETGLRGAFFNATGLSEAGLDGVTLGQQTVQPSGYLPGGFSPFAKSVRSFFGPVCAIAAGTKAQFELMIDAAVPKKLNTESVIGQLSLLLRKQRWLMNRSTR
ncbi:MAG TPA: hypothetical protein VME46_07780 [Acidimicrobiales bacterium]|nr:hypothetical protein [Acidimicrobiales bacterium]